MKLNCQILKEDLHDLDLKSHYTDERLIRRLAFPTLYNGELHPAGNKLYLVLTDDLPETLDFEATPSFICIGKPAELYLKTNCNVLYTEKNIAIMDLLNRILEIFEHYYLLESELQEINNQNLPLRVLGEVAENTFKNPISLIELNFRVIFSIINEKHYYVSPAHMLESQDFIYLDIEDINLLKSDLEYKIAATTNEPTIYSEKLYGYRALYQNIRIDGIVVARLVIYEIGTTFTDRDFALCAYICEHIKNGLLRKDTDNFNQPRGFDEIMNKLVRHIMVDEERIIAVLRENEWEVHDDYFCLNIVPFSKAENDQLISTFAMQLSVHSTNNSYLIKDNTLIFVFNLTRSGISRNAMLSSMVPQLRDWLFKAGISTVFSDFKNLYYYYKQAEYALSVGKSMDSSFWYYRFEDYLLPYIVKKSKETLVPEALYPDGLLRLIAHDQVKETNYCELLQLFLENNMHIANTIKQAFLHRNTFLYRIDRIQEIIQMDLNDPDIRLSLLMAFKIMRS